MVSADSTQIVSLVICWARAKKVDREAFAQLRGIREGSSRKVSL
jgi:hypothetical protein